MKAVVLVLLAVTVVTLAHPYSDFNEVERDQRGELEKPKTDESGQSPHTGGLNPPKKDREGKLLVFASPGLSGLYSDYYGLYPSRRIYADYRYAAFGKFPYTRKGMFSGSNYLYL